LVSSFVSVFATVDFSFSLSAGFIIFSSELCFAFGSSTSFTSLFFSTVSLFSSGLESSSTSVNCEPIFHEEPGSPEMPNDSSTYSFIG